MSYDFEKALAALQDDLLAQAFLEANRDRVLALAAEEVIQILEFFMAGKGEQALLTFYQDQSWPAIKLGLDQMVTGTAGMAERVAAQKEWFLDAAKVAAGLLVTVLAAGF